MLLLLDTHILVRWLAEPERLSREQARALEDAIRNYESVSISAVTLIELAVLADAGTKRLKRGFEDVLTKIETHPAIRVLPVTVEIAREVSRLAQLRDPADRTIAATARVHGLRLVTSDARIIDSGCVSCVE